jgi:hypothetical protein
MDEISLDSHVIGNSLQPSSNIQAEIGALTKLFRGRPLDFITAPIELHKAQISALSEAKRNHSSMSVGVEVNSNALQDSSPSQICSLLDDIHSKLPIEVLLCASNSFTSHISPLILDWAVSKSIPCVASDVLRAHPRSPGTLLRPSLGVGNLPSMPMEQAIEHLQKCFDASIRIEQKFLEKVNMQYCL